MLDSTMTQCRLLTREIGSTETHGLCALEFTVMFLPRIPVWQLVSQKTIQTLEMVAPHNIS